jgi:hypothetical protein
MKSFLQGLALVAVGAVVAVGVIQLTKAPPVGAQPAPPVVKARAVQPRSVYEGATVCHMAADGLHVACDNGYNGRYVK